MTTATYEVFNRGNLAIQAEKFLVPMEAAKALYAELKERREVGPTSGSYWESTFGRPTRRAIRAKAEAVEVWTGGFSTGQFANMLAEVGCETKFAGDR